MPPRPSKADVVIDYKVYVDMFREHFLDKNYLSSHMRREVERCEEVVREAMKGPSIAMVSSGDPELYGMAGAAHPRARLDHTPSARPSALNSPRVNISASSLSVNRGLGGGRVPPEGFSQGVRVPSGDI